MKRYYWCSLLLLMVTACSKFLNKPSNASLPSPATVGDFQAMMDQSTLTTLATPGLGPVYVDDYRPAAAAGLADSFSLGVYTWQPALFASEIEASWSHPYAAIYTCNTVLANLPQLDGLDSADAADARFVMGQAFFLRAFMYYHLAETFGQPYRPATAGTDLGVPLRVSENVMANAPRASMLAVYQQIITDLGRAIPRLPVALQVANRNRPCRAAAYGLLARVWLTCQDYVKAQLYADSSLRSYNSLIDFNAIDPAGLHPFSSAGNSEVLFQCTAQNYPLQYGRSVLVDSTLYSSYNPDDLRQVVFFQAVSSGGHYFKGQYSGLAYLFSGIAVDEVYFISAESKAWNGDLNGAMADVDTLLAKRWRRGHFLTYSALGLTRDSVLHFVLAEKRRETVFREARFFDLRRLNQYPAFAVTLSRVYDGGVFTLSPGSPRYAFPIPQQEIDLGGVVQNPE